jgi:Amt family ammonium transporter
MGQLAGVVIIGAYALTMSILFWTVLRYTIGVRLPPERERSGVDLEELARLSGA